MNASTLFQMAYIGFTLYALTSSNTPAVMDACHSSLFIMVLVQISSLFFVTLFRACTIRCATCPKITQFIFYLLLFALSVAYTAQATLSTPCIQALQSTNSANLPLLIIASWIFTAPCFIYLSLTINGAVFSYCMRCRLD